MLIIFGIIVLLCIIVGLFTVAYYAVAATFIGLALLAQHTRWVLVLAIAGMLVWLAATR